MALQDLKTRMMNRLGETGTTGDLAITDVMAKDLINEGVRDVIAKMPKAKLGNFAKESSAFVPATGSEIETSKLLYVLRSNQHCREIPHYESNRAADQQDFKYATANDPVYYIDPTTNATEVVKVLPTSTSAIGTIVKVSIPDVSATAISITGFPDEIEHLPLRYAVISAKERESSQAKRKSQDEIEAITSNGILSNLSSNATEVEIALDASKTELDKVSGAINNATPEYGKVSGILDEAGTEIDKVQSETNSASTSVGKVASSTASAMAEFALAKAQIDEADTAIDADVDTALAAINTAADRINTAVALANAEIDKIVVDSNNTELITNGDFVDWTTDNPDDWTVFGEVGSDPEVSQVSYGSHHSGGGTGACNLYTTSDKVGIKQLNILEIGKTYKIKLDVSISVGGIKVTNDVDSADVSYGVFDSSGLQQEATFVAVGTGIFIKRQTGAANIDIDNVSIKEVSGLLDHANTEFDQVDALLDKGETDSETEVNTVLGYIRTTSSGVAAKITLAETHISNATGSTASANAEYGKMDGLLDIAENLSASASVSNALNSIKTSASRINTAVGYANDEFDNVLQNVFSSASTEFNKISDLLDVSSSLSVSASVNNALNNIFYSMSKSASSTASANVIFSTIDADIDTAYNTINSDEDIEIGQGELEVANARVANGSAFLKQAQERINEAQAYSQEVQARLAEAQSVRQDGASRVGSGSAFLQEAQARLQGGNAYLQEASMAVQEASAYAGEVQARLSQAQTKRQEATSRAGSGDAFLKEAQTKLSTADSYFKDVQASLNELQGFAKEIETRLGQATTKRSEGKSRIDSGMAYIQEALGRIQTAQAYLQEAQASGMEAQTYATEVDARVKQVAGYNQNINSRINEGMAYLKKADMDLKESQGHGNIAQLRIANGDAYLKEGRARIENGNAYINEAGARIQNADGFLRESSARMNKSSLYLNEAQTRLNNAQTYILSSRDAKEDMAQLRAEYDKAIQYYIGIDNEL